MEQGFLIYTNILIYYLNGQIPELADKVVTEAFEKSFNISVISKIELLGWHKFTKSQYEKAKMLVDAANLFPLDDIVVEKTIELRRRQRIRTPDAIIAATCISHDLILMTRNEKDFDSVENLEVFNPFRE